MARYSKNFEGVIEDGVKGTMPGRKFTCYCIRAGDDLRKVYVLGESDPLPRGQRVRVELTTGLEAFWSLLPINSLDNKTYSGRYRKAESISSF